MCIFIIGILIPVLEVEGLTGQSAYVDVFLEGVCIHVCVHTGLWRWRAEKLGYVGW